jgi:energy-coupling factor transporter ATP-binding protein EcfA2
MRRRASGLPAGKTFDAWEEKASVIPKPTQQALQTLEWVNRAEALVVCGPSGTGKSHFIEALGHLAIDKGRTVAWHTLDTLAALFRRHRADDSINKAISKLIHSDLILIDLCRYRDYAETDFGWMESAQKAWALLERPRGRGHFDRLGLSGPAGRMWCRCPGRARRTRRSSVVKLSR